MECSVVPFVNEDRNALAIDTSVGGDAHDVLTLILYDWHAFSINTLVGGNAHDIFALILLDTVSVLADESLKAQFIAWFFFSQAFSFQAGGAFRTQREYAAVNAQVVLAAEALFTVGVFLAQ